jgi:hypothetical protein
MVRGINKDKNYFFGRFGPGEDVIHVTGNLQGPGEKNAIPARNFPVSKSFGEIMRDRRHLRSSLYYVSVHCHLVGNRRDDKKVVKSRTVTVRKDDRGHVGREIG